MNHVKKDSAKVFSELRSWIEGMPSFSSKLHSLTPPASLDCLLLLNHAHAHFWKPRGTNKYLGENAE